jgi:hypothetical protein
MQWSWFEPIGYIGSLLMFMTFFMKTMIPLRVTAITANCVMIVYTASAGIVPVLILQCCLLPLNVVRFIQMKRLVARVRESSTGSLQIEPLLPFMTKEPRRSGDVLFHAGDHSDRMYYLQRGKVVLKEPALTLGDGEIFGEIGLLSADNTRTATAVCGADCDLYSVTRDVVLQLFYQRPEFGFFLVRLVTSRLIANLASTQQRHHSIG